jgi:hypothetical protein
MVRETPFVTSALAKEVHCSRVSSSLEVCIPQQFEDWQNEWEHVNCIREKKTVSRLFESSSRGGVNLINE